MAFRRSRSSDSTTSATASRAESSASPISSRTVSTGTRSQSSSPRFAAQRAPRRPLLPASRAAVIAAPPAARAIGEIGRRPVGPRRSSSAAPAPIIAPRTAAVSRSYCWSRPLARSRSDTRSLVPFALGLTVVAMGLLSLLERVVFESLHVHVRNHSFHFIAERGGARSHAAQRRCRRYESILDFPLHYPHERVQLVEPPLSGLHGHRQPLVRQSHRLVELLHIDPDRRRDVIDVVGDRVRVPHQRTDVSVEPID